MHPTRNSAALIINGSSGRVMPGVMSPLRVPVRMCAASAPLNLRQLEGYLSTSAHDRLVARSLSWIQVLISGAAAE